MSRKILVDSMNRCNVGGKVIMIITRKGAVEKMEEREGRGYEIKWK